MTSDAQVAPDWVSLLAPKVRRGVEAAMAQNPAAYSDALRRVTGGATPLDKQTADTVASILIGSTVNSADVDIANAAVALGVHDPGAGLQPQRRIVSLAGKDLAIEALAPKTIRELNLGISSGTNFGQLISNSLVEVLHTQVSKIFWDEFAKAFVTDGWSQILWQSMIGEAFRTAATNKIRRALGLAATSGFEDFSTLSPDVTVTGAAKFITPWADNYANTQIENYDVMSARAVQDSLTRYMQQGLSSQAMASRIRASYGLDTKSAFALDAYRDTMLVQRPKQAGIIGKLVLGYADRLLKTRTDMVGQTTAMTALNFGRLLVFTQAQARGDLPPDVQKVWVTAIDERVCPTCRPMDGTSIDMNEPFQVRFHSGARTHKKAKAVLKEGDVTELLVPPAHPNCRCTIVLSTEFDQGIITQTARNAGRGLSVPEDKVLAKAWNPSDEIKHPRGLDGRWIADLLNGEKSVKYAPHREMYAVGDGTTGRKVMQAVNDYFSKSKIGDSRLSIVKQIEAGIYRNAMFRDSTVMGLVHAHAVMDLPTIPDVDPLPDGATEEEKKAWFALWDNRADLKQQAGRTEAAQRILQHPGVRLIAHPEYGDALLHFSSLADIWSDTHEGPAIIRQAAAALHPDEYARLAKTTVRKSRKTLFPDEVDALRPLIDAVDVAPKNAPVLYRGIVAPTSAVVAMRPGDTFSLLLSSFSYDRDLATGFARTFPKENIHEYLSGPEDYAKRSILPVLYQLEDGSRSLHISPLNFGTGQNEWITRGSFVITQIKESEINGIPYTLIRVAQVTSMVSKRKDQTENPAIAILNSALPQDEEITKAWKPDLHPRDSDGKFADKIHTGLKSQGVGQYYQPRRPQSNAKTIAIALGALAAGGVAAKFYKGWMIPSTIHTLNVGWIKDGEEATWAGSVMRNVSAEDMKEWLQQPNVRWEKHIKTLDDSDLFLTGTLHRDAFAHLEGKSGAETMTNIESAIKTKKTEFAFVVHNDGKIIAGFKGTKDAVAIPTPNFNPVWVKMSSKLTLTHNHPAGFFAPVSAGDLVTAVNSKIPRVRAIDDQGNLTEVDLLGVAQSNQLRESVNAAVNAFNQANHDINAGGKKFILSGNQRSKMLNARMDTIYRDLMKKYPAFTYRVTRHK